MFGKELEGLGHLYRFLFNFRLMKLELVAIGMIGG